MWEPRPLATLGASTACNRDIFKFLKQGYYKICINVLKICSGERFIATEQATREEEGIEDPGFTAKGPRLRGRGVRRTGLPVAVDVEHKPRYRIGTGNCEWCHRTVAGWVSIVVILYTPTQEVHMSNLDRDTDFPDPDSSHFSSVSCMKMPR
jgi:hypothetical protein